MTERKKPEILITGAGGALAQEVIDRVKDRYTVVLVDFRRRVRVDEGMHSYRVEYNKRGLEDIFRKHDIEAVIHLVVWGCMSLLIVTDTTIMYWERSDC